MRLHLNGFSAWITINDVEQSNHSIEYSPDGSSATCWIISEAGKNFSVHWQDLQRTFPSRGQVFVDGMSGRGTVLTEPARRYIDSQDGFRTSKETKRLFMFSEMEPTDDDQYLHTATTDLGTIKLEIWHCKVLDRSRKPSNRVRTYSDPQKIHERSKKALGHRCLLGPDVLRIQRSACKVTNLDKIVTFEFKYRPLARLQANGIIPLDQNRKRATEPNEIIDLSREDEDNGTLQRIQALRAELRQLEEMQRK